MVLRLVDPTVEKWAVLMVGRMAEMTELMKVARKVVAMETKMAACLV